MRWLGVLCLDKIRMLLIDDRGGSIEHDRGLWDPRQLASWTTGPLTTITCLPFFLGLRSHHLLHTAYIHCDTRRRVTVLSHSVISRYFYSLECGNFSLVAAKT